MLDVLKITPEWENELIETRRHLHKFPEAGGFEERTSEYLKAEMAKLGYEAHKIVEYCYYYVLDTGMPGKTLVMRADIDGLKMDESEVNTAGINKPTVSEIPGMCHSCGHDAHTAILLTAVKILTKHKDELKGGKIYFLFEAGEENGYSAYQNAEWLEELKPDGMWGLHVSTAHPSGVISLEAGAKTAGTKSFSVTVKGRGGHSSRPDQSINPILGAANAMVATQSIINVYTDPMSATTIAVTAMSGGTTHNIFPDEATFMGGFRYSDITNGKIVTEKLPEVVANAAANYGCTTEFKFGATEALPTVNDPAMSAIAEGALRKVHPEMEAQYGMIMGGESMGLYFTKVPGCFAWVGMADKEKGTDAPHHNALFDVDESMLKPALDVSLQFASGFLES